MKTKIKDMTKGEFERALILDRSHREPDGRRCKYRVEGVAEVGFLTKREAYEFWRDVRSEAA